MGIGFAIFYYTKAKLTRDKQSTNLNLPSIKKRTPTDFENLSGFLYAAKHPYEKAHSGAFSQLNWIKAYTLCFENATLSMPLSIFAVTSALVPRTCAHVFSLGMENT